MTQDEIIEDILSGTSVNEQPDDALYLCMEMALSMYRPSWHQRRANVRTTPGREAMVFHQLLILSGKILCTIFDHLKPADYFEEMTTTRLQYAGIFTNFELREIYHKRVEKLLEKGHLQSLEKAIKRKVWVLLRPKLSGETASKAQVAIRPSSKTEENDQAQATSYLKKDMSVSDTGAQRSAKRKSRHKREQS